MQFSLTAEQEDLRSALSGLLADRADLATTRAAVDAGERPDRGVWAALVEMGVATVDLAEQLGGTGLGAVELAVVLEQAGAVLYPGPLLASTGFAAGLVAGDDEGSAALARRLADGQVLAAAVPDRPGSWTPDAVAARARETADGWRLDGTKEAVLQADEAELLLVAARTPEGDVALFAVRPADAGIVPEPSLDTARSLCRVELDHTPAELVLRHAEDRLGAAGLRAAAALAAESAGAARTALELTASYVTTRRQFGQPVGAFQGVKHRLADLLVEVELATSAAYLAACHLAAGDLDAASVSAPLAVHAATAALARAGADAVQLHGGMGFTWESPCHWFVTWGQTSRWLLGGDADRLERIYDRAHLMTT
jgi:alkylation response protein AidB-like acyl-CoA dehydrogenase